MIFFLTKKNHPVKVSGYILGELTPLFSFLPSISMGGQLLRYSSF